jgi:hypothetical protein
MNSLPDTFTSHFEMILKRLPHRILSLESTTHPEGAGDE